MHTTMRLAMVAVGALLAFALNAGPAGAVVDPSAQRCINALNKALAKVVKVQGDENDWCVRAGVKGAADPQACVTVDLRGKVGSAKANTTNQYARKCSLPPPLGPTSPSVVNAAGVEEQVALLADVFGGTLNGVIVGGLIGDCQKAVGAGMKDVSERMLDEFYGLKKAALRAGAMTANQLAAPLGQDSKGRIAKAVAKLGSQIAKKCNGVNVTATFPGLCSGSAVGGLAACVDRLVRCRACRTVQRADNLQGAIDCDLFDDALSNGSCQSIPVPTSTPTVTLTSTASRTPTPTITPGCPLTPGNYALTQVAGGSMNFDGLPAWPFPAGGSIVQTVGPGDENCVHDTVVPFPGGYAVPALCVPAFGFTLSLVQTGCGIGRIDSNGGSDFTVSEIGDTSSPGPPCWMSASCVAGANSNVRVDVTVGDGLSDTCAMGTANLVASIPVFATWWWKLGQCPDFDGMYDPSTDILVFSMPLTLDFTTDLTATSWADIGLSDGCALAGSGPPFPYPNPVAGSCINLGGMNVAGADVTLVATAPAGSSGSPLYDLSFMFITPNELTTIGGPAATCASPPPINFSGEATRCVP